MGKISKIQHHQLQQIQIQTPPQTHFCFCCCSYSTPLFKFIRNSISFKCLLVLVLSLALFLSAIFWIPPFNRLNSGSDLTLSDQLGAAVKASFRLQKPVSVLVAHAKTLESDILGEIGVPNTKVSILYIHQSGVSNWTDVAFGVLPDPGNVPINSASLSVLRSSLIELFLNQLNLSLTASIFGQPSSFQIMKFTGGITVIPLQSASIWQLPQILFNFTLNNSISQIEGSFDQLKEQLKSGLDLRFPEDIYLQLTNANGSTVKPPVTVQASVLSDAGSLLPQRLKQLAQTITGSSHEKNLGLDHSVFGNVRGISLSSVLNCTFETPSPTLSPSPSPSEREQYSAPSISPLPAPSPYSPPSGDHNLSPCSDCVPYAPNPVDEPFPPSPSSSESPEPSPLSNSPIGNPYYDFADSPSPVPTTHLDPSFPPDFPPRPATQPPMGPTQQSLNDLSPAPSMPYNSSPGLCHNKMWLNGLLGALVFLHLACVLYS